MKTRWVYKVPPSPLPFGERKLFGKKIKMARGKEKGKQGREKGKTRREKEKCKGKGRLKGWL